MAEEVSYLSYDDFLLAAAQVLGADPEAVRWVTSRPLAESALAAPAAGFGGHEPYPGFATKAAVLLERLARNHPLPDGNKRTALQCAILFANVNGYEWRPPQGDEPDGAETAEVVEAAAAGGVSLGALAAWVDDRLVPVPAAPPLAPAGAPAERPSLVVYPAEYVGPLAYEEHTVRIGDLVVRNVHGYNPAAVYVRRVGGKTEGISVAEIVVSVVGDRYAQEELDEQNAEAERYPLGAKEYWRARLVSEAFHPDGHAMTDEEFEAEWAEGEQE